MRGMRGVRDLTPDTSCRRPAGLAVDVVSGYVEARLPVRSIARTPRPLYPGRGRSGPAWHGISPSVGSGQGFVLFF